MEVEVFTVTSTSIRLDDETRQRLAVLSARTGRPQSFYLREAITRHLDEVEYIYGLVADAEDVRAGRLKTVTLDELAAECGVDN